MWWKGPLIFSLPNEDNIPQGILYSGQNEIKHGNTGILLLNDCQCSCAMAAIVTDFVRH